ncbi:MAG TPA: hypothetical protein O0X66_03520 [Methanocorpusculum sp.]|nr:hypothetical protein [Methanocorpusculum sp.]HJJ53553.1 hypothetical protein [Methanocorpusculum sp.]
MNGVNHQVRAQWMRVGREADDLSRANRRFASKVLPCDCRPGMKRGFTPDEAMV